jgi:hypothetical protein
VLLLFFFSPNCGSSWSGHDHLGIGCGWDGVGKKIIASWSSMIGNRSPCRSFAHSSPLTYLAVVPFLLNSLGQWTRKTSLNTAPAFTLGLALHRCTFLLA